MGGKNFIHLGVSIFSKLLVVVCFVGLKRFKQKQLGLIWGG